MALQFVQAFLQLVLRGSRYRHVFGRGRVQTCQQHSCAKKIAKHCGGGWSEKVVLVVQGSGVEFLRALGSQSAGDSSLIHTGHATCTQIQTQIL